MGLCSLGKSSLVGRQIQNLSKLALLLRGAEAEHDFILLFPDMAEL